MVYLLPGFMQQLFIIPSWYPSRLNPVNGAFFVDWAKLLATAGFDVTVIASLVHPFKAWPARRQLPPKANQAQIEQGLRTYRRETINPFPRLQSLSFRFYRRQLLRQFDLALAEQGPPDVLLIHSSLWAGAALTEWMRTTSTPCVIIEHMKAFLLDEGFTRYQLAQIRQAYQGVDRVVAVSKALESRVKQIFPMVRERTAVIHNPLPEIESITGLAAVGDTPFTFISVAYLRPEKRLDILLQAFARLLDMEQNALLKLVGDGPLRVQLEKLADRLGIRDRVTFVGNLDRRAMRDELLSSHCLVLSSEVETFGLALVEAMACGLPVISTRCGGPEDIVTDEAGVLVPVNNAVSLSLAMGELMTNLSRYSPAIIQAYAQEHFSSEGYVSALKDLFSELAGSV
jgi:glycosyltransferase involved in cell wall biosynthesis